MNEHGQVYFFSDLEERSMAERRVRKLREDRQRYADAVAKGLEDFESQFLNTEADKLRADLRSRDAESR